MKYIKTYERYSTDDIKMTDEIMLTFYEIFKKLMKEYNLVIYDIELKYDIAIQYKRETLYVYCETPNENHTTYISDPCNKEIADKLKNDYDLPYFDGGFYINFNLYDSNTKIYDYIIKEFPEYMDILYPIISDTVMEYIKKNYPDHWLGTSDELGLL